MEFFTQAVNVLKILVMAVGAGLGAWGVINLILWIYGICGRQTLQSSRYGIALRHRLLFR